jgi:DNA-binding beta-propeller fold protein YncE
MNTHRMLLLAVALFASGTCFAGEQSTNHERRFLYVAVPGERDDLHYGGHGILVFDIDSGHRFVRRIAMGGLDEHKKPLNVKGICASANTGRLYVSTPRTLMALDLRTDRLLWEHPYDGGCDRMSISPDGRTIYLPSFEHEHWHVVNAEDGAVIAKIVPRSRSHNTVFGLDGKHVYLAGLGSPWLTVADTAAHTVSRRVGPFSAAIRPFTVNGEQTLCFVTVNELLGFEIGDITTGKKIHRVEVAGFKKGPTKRHGCPSHGVGLTPDEKEIWVTDGHNHRLHIFDVSSLPPRQIASVTVRDEPDWITFGIDGRYAYPSCGDVIETATRRIVARLIDEHGTAVQSEKLLEIDFHGAEPIQAGDQFGIGRKMQDSVQ